MRTASICVLSINTMSMHHLPQLRQLRLPVVFVVVLIPGGGGVPKQLRVRLLLRGEVRPVLHRNLSLLRGQPRVDGLLVKGRLRLLVRVVVPELLVVAGETGRNFPLLRR